MLRYVPHNAQTMHYEDVQVHGNDRQYQQASPPFIGFDESKNIEYE